MVLFDPEADLITDVLLEEDGHAQERSLLDDVIGRLNARDLVVADRNMCVRRFLLGIMAKGGFSPSASTRKSNGSRQVSSGGWAELRAAGYASNR